MDGRRIDVRIDAWWITMGRDGSKKKDRAGRDGKQ